MKKLLLFIFLLWGFLYAQVPQGIAFQGIARNENGECLANETLSLNISILESLTGPTVYTEAHNSVKTDTQGIYAITIGTGTSMDSFEEIDWSTPKWVGLSINGVSVVPVELLSTPFAFFAENGKLLDNTGTEYIDFVGQNGFFNARIGRRGLNHGLFTLNDPNGRESVRMTSESTQQGAGVMFLRGPNSLNFLLSVLDSVRADNPSMSFYDANSLAKITLQVNGNGEGVISGDRLEISGVKNFVIPHPNDPSKEIVYACIEGPEAAAYERGTATLVNGEAEIIFSNHFGLVANHETMTVIVTPRSPDSKGLAAFEYTEKGFKVKELFQGTGNYAFDWEVKAVRKGLEDYEAIRDVPNR